ncbi:hypothetical protein PAPHI01_1266 [Pancytospora philotis]|nr:hypothetical protein PAPHI01_1266 [Pancytospora philotis]
MTISLSNLPQFIVKLYGILGEPKYAQHILWGEDGTSFIIADPVEFSSAVLAVHFKHSNISSFIRQLNKYGFHKVKSSEEMRSRWGAGAWEFAHKNFRRDRLDLVALITRKPAQTETSSRSRRAAPEAQAGSSPLMHTYVSTSMNHIAKYFEVIIEDLNQIKRYIITRSTSRDAQALRALVAEDNAYCATYAISIFKKNRITTASAESVRELRFLITTTQFQMVLISNAVPGVAEVLKEIRAAQPGAVVILTVDESEKNDPAQHKYTGVDKILYKSFSHNDLVSIIKSHQAMRPAYYGEAARFYDEHTNKFIGEYVELPAANWRNTN